LQIPEEHRLAYDLTAEATIVHCYMVQGAKREFDEIPGVQFLEECGFHIGIDGAAYGLKGQAVCRFKKFGEDGRSRNYQTERQEAMRRNEPLDGMPERATFVDIGYSLNPLRTKIMEVQAIRLIDQGLILSIPRSDDDSIQMPGNLPFGPVPAAPRFEVIAGSKKKVENDK
jgi:hypothetical protein